jgi:hypothetical protein
MRKMIGGWLWVGVLVVVLGRAGEVRAHAGARTSVVEFDVRAGEVDAEVDLALDQLAMALGRTWVGGCRCWLRRGMGFEAMLVSTCGSLAWVGLLGRSRLGRFRS